MLLSFYSVAKLTSSNFPPETTFLHLCLTSFHHLTVLPSLCTIRAALKNHFHLLLSPLDSQCANYEAPEISSEQKGDVTMLPPERGTDNVPWVISEPTQQPAHKVFCWKKSCVLLYTIMVRVAQHGSPDWLEGLLSGSHLGKYHPLEVCKTSILHFATTLQGQEIPVTTFTV